MTVSTYIAACLAFCASFAVFKVLPAARREMAYLWAALVELNSSELSDEQKEANVRKAGREALSGVSRLFARLLGVMAAATIPVWLASLTGLSSAHEVANFAIRYDVMAITTLAAAILVFVSRHISLPGNR